MKTEVISSFDQRLGNFFRNSSCP